MLEIFLLAGGDGSGGDEYRHPLRTLKQELDLALSEVTFKDKSAATSYLATKGLLYTDICDQAEELYRTMKDRNRWLPAKHVVDPKAVPAQFANLSKVELLALMQQGFASGKCHNCQQEGHFARNCPLRSKGKGSRDKPRPKPGTKTKHWRSTPPRDGDSPTKSIHGKTYRWCAKCTRWTTTHDTATHMGGKGSKGKPKENERGSSTPSDANLNLFLVPDPAAWNVSFEFPDYLAIFCLIGHSILQCLLPMCVGALIVLTNEFGFNVLVAHVTSLLSLLISIAWDNKQYTVFFVWLLAISFVMLWSPGSALPEQDRRPRWVRHAELKSYRRATKPSRHFIRVRPRPPTLHEQALLRHLDVMHFNLLKFLHEFRADYCSSHQSPRGAHSSEGETDNCHSLHDPGPRQCSRGGPRNHHK